VQYHQFQNYTLTSSCTYYGIQLSAKECTPCLFSQSVAGQFASKW